jgi:hypothetical protein
MDNQNNYNGIRQCAWLVFNYFCHVPIAIVGIVAMVGVGTYDCIRDVCTFINRHCCNRNNEEVEHIDVVEHVDVVIAGDVEEGHG